MRTPTEILKSMVADIEAMKAGPVFGTFKGWVSGNDGRVYIEWPNLAILLDEAKQSIEPGYRQEGVIKEGPSAGEVVQEIKEIKQ